MAISAYLNSFNKPLKGAGRPGSQPKDDKGAVQPAAAALGRVVSTPLSLFQPKAGEAAAKPPSSTVAKVSPAFTAAIRPGIISNLAIPPFIAKLPPQFFLLPKTTTQLAQGSIQQLEKVNPAVLREAINTLKNKKIAAGGLMNYLERKVIIGEVLNELAKDWSNDTKEDFAAAFQMDSNKSEAMDSIVSIAVLNDHDLGEEIQIENTPETTEGDLLENRRIVWQYPPPGTPLDPPYLVLVAVEHQEVAKAEEIVQSIMKELVSYQEYKIPKAAAQKLR